MNPRNTAILFLVAAVVVGAVWWNENVRKGRLEEAEAEAKELFPGVEAEDLRWIALTTTDGKAVRLEHREGAWRLVEPLDFPADATSLNGIAGALADVKSEGVIDSPQGPEIYGLGEGAPVVRFGTDGETYALHLGEKTPVGGNTYAAREEGASVYTIPTFRASALRRRLADLREKRVLRFDREAVERIELSWPGDGATLERREGAWRLVAPVQDDADELTVSELLSDLSFLRADDFIDAPPADPEVGLDRPAFEAKLVVPSEGDEQPEQIFHLVLGQELEDGRHRAARGREHTLYLVPSERLEDLPRTVGAYRFKQLASFVASDARQLELAFHEPDGGAHVVTAERGESGWESAPEPMAPGRAARIVAELASLRGTDLLADAMGEAEQARLGLSPPRLRLTVRGEGVGEALGAVLAEVWLGEADSERGIVARSADSPRVYRIDFALGEHLPLNLEAFRNRFVAEEAPETEPVDLLEPFEPLTPSP